MKNRFSKVALCTLPILMVSTFGSSSISVFAAEAKAPDLNVSQQVIKPYAESYIDVVQDRMKQRDKESKLNGKPINMQEQIIDGWFLARFWIFKDQNNSHQANRFISWFKDNIASSKGYNSIAEQMGLKIEAENDMDVTNIDYTSKTGDTIYNGISELKNYTGSTQKMKTDSFQRDYTKSQSTSVTNGLQLGFKVAAKGIIALTGADFETSVTYNLSTTTTETNTISDKFTVPSQEVTLPSGHKAIVKHDLRKMVYYGTHDLKGDLIVSFNDKEIVQKFIYPNYREINLSDIRKTMIEIDEWNHLNPVNFYELVGVKNHIKNGETLYIDTPAKFMFNGANPYYRATFTEYDENDNPVQTKVLSENFKF
ncbi:epsilon-toxin family protein [Bacillus thuringiensis]|uniref:epsilon-toxin family protein n=1 Tax=Bacillus thuringiensis TaxID=1428 RepID=UPI0026E3CDF2|nr:epsilon-toxin family protein [Bacillus thuringiensis]MDO6632219.1 epsilon-toxin family protein [Bacillus thuringiensis]MDO6663049.1 epsilon-toxin family protein [Bacillus thuringiensis]MDO6702425.1 epsilon-toxin family protein [Bacillus thuringiensis]